MKQRILVLEAEKPAAYSLIRAVSSHGIEAVATSHLRINPCSVSRYTSEFRICPDIETNLTEYSEWLTDEVKRNPYLTIMSFSDKSTRLLSEQKQELSKYTYIYQPDKDILELILNKKNTLALARQYHVEVPVSYTFEIQKKIEILDKIHFPVVLKPHRKIDWKNGRAVFNKIGRDNYVWNKMEFEIKLGKILKKTDNFEIQEYIPGVGRGYFTVILNNRCLCDMAHERLREFPVSGGASSFRKIIHYEEMKNISSPLLKSLNWSGPIMFEYKYNPENSRYYLMEINGRWWGSLPLAINAGINMPLFFINALAGKETLNPGDYPLGFTSRLFFPHDFIWFLAMLGRFRLKKSLDFFRHSDSEDLWDWKDKKPFFANIFASLIQRFKQAWRLTKMGDA